MSNREFHKVWMEQCQAAEDIRLRYGPKAAFDYVVGEKLLNFAGAAASHPEFARELPRFVARVRDLFPCATCRDGDAGLSAILFTLRARWRR